MTDEVEAGIRQWAFDAMEGWSREGDTQFTLLDRVISADKLAAWVMTGNIQSTFKLPAVSK